MARVLVVDDDSDSRTTVRLGLEADGHQVDLARDQAEALAAMAAAPPDLVLVDVATPGAGGWALLQRLKVRGGPGADVPVVLLTSGAPDDRVRGGIEGAVCCIDRPADGAAVAAHVRAVLEGGPEPAQRRHARQAALEELARLEKGAPTATAASSARPRLTRLERTAPAPAAAGPDVRAAREMLDQLSAKQRELLDVLARSVSVSEAAHELAVSRSNVYASLRRISRKLGIPTVPELLDLVRHRGLLGPSPPE